MGVTKGGVLVPRPFGYDWELFNAAMDPAGRTQTFLRATLGAPITIITRVPQNADIDASNYIYLYIRSNGAFINGSIIITRLEPPYDTLGSVHLPPGDIATSWTARRYMPIKINDPNPGDKIQIVINANTTLTIDVMTYQKDTFFSSALVGQVFPYSRDFITSPPYNAPAVFLDYLDADANVITEWMPGLLPMIDRGLVTSSRNFCGNIITMPFTDRRPSGLWFYSAAPGGGNRTVRIYAEPSGPTDLTELYSLTFAAPSGTHKMVYVPFGDGAPRFVRGSRYIVGLDMVTPASPDVLWHAWIREGGSPPAWTVDPVHLGFDNMVEFASIVSGAWDYTPAGYHCELGLVFEESET